MLAFHCKRQQPSSKQHTLLKRPFTHLGPFVDCAEPAMDALVGGQPNDAAIWAESSSPTAVLAERQKIMKGALRPCNRDFQLTLR